MGWFSDKQDERTGKAISKEDQKREQERKDNAKSWWKETKEKDKGKSSW